VWFTLYIIYRIYIFAMFISRTPLRVSFTGWGSDLPSFYKEHWGAVLSTSIDKWVTVLVNKKFDNKIRLWYSETENVEHANELKHEYAKQILNLLDIDWWLEITSVADIPSKWSWLWSSSSFTVAMLHALHAHKWEYVSAERLAQEACLIEIEKCGKPIWKQDQYAAAYWWLNFIEFNPDDTVSVKKIICLKETKQRLQDNLLMMYTWITRSASDILSKQNQNMLSDQKKVEIMKKMVWLSYDLKKDLENNDLNNFWEILHQNRELKKEMAWGISNPQIDNRYHRARRAWASWGKLLWAWWGWFFLFYAPKEKHQDIITALPELRNIDFNFENEWSKIIFTY